MYFLLMDIIVFSSKFDWNLTLRVNWQYAGNGSDNDLTKLRIQ